MKYKMLKHYWNTAKNQSPRLYQDIDENNEYYYFESFIEIIPVLFFDMIFLILIAPIQPY